MKPSTAPPIRVAVTYRVCQGWRLPIFKRLADYPDIHLKVFHGQDIPGTKLINAGQFGDLQHQEIRTYALRMRSSGRKVPLLFYPGILMALERYRPDVLLCEGGSNILNNLLIYGWARFRKIPTIWWCLGEIPGRQYHGISRLYRWIRIRLMRRTSVLLGYSSRAVASFQREGLTQPMFKAVNCVDTDRVFERIAAAMRASPTVRERMKLSQKKVLLFVGALEPEKRIDVLLYAYQKVQNGFNNIALLIVGDGSALSEARRLSTELDLRDVYFTGRIIENVSEYFLAADLFVLPGLGGLAISEAMAHGLPVICTTADGCECDLIKAEQNGVILPEGDIDAFSQAILRIISNPQDCAAMGKASLSIIQHEHNVNTYIQGIVDAVHCANQIRSTH